MNSPRPPEKTPASIALEDLKGQLLARRANLQAAAEQLTARVLVLEENARDVRAQCARAAGAIAEIDHTLQLLDQPAPK